MQHRRRAQASSFVQLLVVFATLVLFSSRASFASEPPRVVIVTDGALPVTGERVRAELNAMGFAIVLDPGGTVDAALADIAEAKGAMAAVALTFSAEGIELWVVERATRRTRLRSFVHSEPTPAGATLALRTAELLRASLLDVAGGHASAVDAAPAGREPGREGTPEPPLPVAPGAAGEAAVSPAPASLGPGARRTLTLHLGAGLVTSAGGLGFFPGAELAGKWWFSEQLGVELAALVPLAGMSQNSSEGSSTTRVAALSLAIVASVPIGSGVWVWDIGAGIAGMAVQTRGTLASAGYTQEENVGVGVAPLLRSALWYSLTGRSRLGLGASLGVSVPRFLVMHAGTMVATWGVPFALGQLALEVDVL